MRERLVIKHPGERLKLVVFHCQSEPRGLHRSAVPCVLLRFHYASERESVVRSRV